MTSILTDLTSLRDDLAHDLSMSVMGGAFGGDKPVRAPAKGEVEGLIAELEARKEGDRHVGVAYGAPDALCQEAAAMLRRLSGGYAAGIEAAAKVAENFLGKAHTYASENADLYRAQDAVCNRIAER